MKETLEQFVRRLAMHGGSIVSSNSCSGLEIAQAQACERFFVFDDGLGLVYRPESTNETQS
ncbi:MAG: hypothetical protein WBV94_21745 [Blastocatellia bacterium]